MIYFISDTHFYHHRILEYTNRPFDRIEDMNETIIENWNKVVTPKDTVYHLGDVGFCNEDLILEIKNRLNGKICLIRGNHDGRSASSWERLGFVVLRNAPIKIEKENIILSHVPLPDTMIPKGYLNLHGHIHNKKLNECYYHNNEPIIEYPEDKYSQNLHFNVSVENINLTPINLEEIRSRITKGEYYLE